MIQRDQIGRLLPEFAFIVTVFTFIRYFHFTVLCIASFILALAGCAMWLYGVISLGEAFSTKIETKQLVTDGIYAKIRHPIYIAITLVLIGLGGMVQNWNFFYIIGVIVILLIIRAYMEEKKLAAAFGQEYQDYKKQTWF